MKIILGTIGGLLIFFSIGCLLLGIFDMAFIGIILLMLILISSKYMIKKAV